MEEHKHETVAVIQARCGSTRLPGKVLMNLDNQCVLWHVVNRIYQAKSIGSIIVVTSVKAGDDPVAKFCSERGISFYRGSEDDVLDRFYQAVKLTNAKYVFRMTADCPLLDPEIIDAVAAKFFATGCDYCSNSIKHRTFPKGLDCELFTRTALETAWTDGHAEPDREHVTWYIYKHEPQFKCEVYEQDRELGEIRWTVDTQADFDYLHEVFRKLTEAKGGQTGGVFPDGATPLQTNPHVFHQDEVLQASENDEHLQQLQIECQQVGYGLKDGTPTQPKPNRGTKGQALRREADSFLVGMPHSPCKQWPQFFYTAKKAALFDLDGIKYLDFNNCPCLFGYNNDNINRAVIDMIDRGDVASLPGSEPVKASKNILEAHPWADGIRLTCSEDAALNVAIQAARTFTKRTRVVTLGPNYGRGVPVTHASWTVDKLKEIVTADVAAVILAPKFEGEEEFAAVKEAAEAAGAVLVADERFSCHRACVCGIVNTYQTAKPDMVVYGSTIANGYPAGVVVGRLAIVSRSTDMLVGDITRSSAQAILTCLKLSRDALNVLQDNGTHLYERLVELQDKHKHLPFRCEKIQGLSSLLRMTFETGAEQDQERLISAMLDRCILLGPVLAVGTHHDKAMADALVTALDSFYSQ